MRRLVSLLPFLVLACGTSGPAPVALAPRASASASTSSSASASASSVASAVRPPPTPKIPVTTTYHGVKVVDDYRWLENSSAPEVKAWSDAENRYARSVLDALPSRADVRARVETLLTASNGAHFDLRHTRGALFAMRDQPPKQQPFLVTLANIDEKAKESETPVVDPNAIDPTGKTAIDWYVPSEDGKLVAVSLSEGGSESGDVHVYDVATKKELAGDRIPRVNGGTAGGSLTWRKDGKGFWYTRYPHKGERPDADLDFFQQVFFHALGTPESKDVYAVGKTFPRIAEVMLQTSRDGRWVVATVANGDGGQFEHWLLDTSAKKPDWARFATYDDQIHDVAIGLDGTFYLHSRKAAPRGRVLRASPAKIAPAQLVAKATEVVPQSDATIEQLALTKSRLYVSELVGGPSRVRSFDLAGKEPIEIPIPAVTSVQQIEPASDASDDLLLRNRSFVRPSRWLRWDAKAAKVEETALATELSTKLPELEVSRETATSMDGTHVPVNIVRKVGTPRDGHAMTLLSGYGGYGVSEVPTFRPELVTFLEQGGVYVLANLRGGGEFGEAWHQAGMLTKKQNVFDDFAAAAGYLVDAKVTNRDRLAILGGSNGGLLMGAELVQHPDMFRAVVSFVGIYDMLRVEDTPNGAFNVTEYGTVKDRAQFDALYAYSPYHHVVDGVAYPPVLFLTGANDPRVEPWQSRKMTARLQAAEHGQGLVLLRTSEDTGHGIGSPLSAIVDEYADVYSFLFRELGHAYAKVQ